MNLTYNTAKTIKATSEITNHFQKDRYLIKSTIKANDFYDSNLNSSSGFESFIFVLFSIFYLLVAVNIVTPMVANEIKTEIDDILKDSAAPYFDEFALD